MIPKIIHYCWFGHKPLPSLALKCIASWKKYLPDYDIKEWNENNFDTNIIPYVKEAYEAKKYAFVSDFARFWILYHYGGLYFDTDVEIIRNMDDIIDRGPFMGRELDLKSQLATIGANPGLGLGCNPGLSLYKEIIDYYSQIHFVKEDGNLNLITVVDHTTEILVKYGLQNKDEIQKCAGIFIYPKEYFCPKSYEDRRIVITQNTRTIHHYAESWVPDDIRKKNLKEAFKLRHPLIFKIYHYCIGIPKYNIKKLFT